MAVCPTLANDVIAEIESALNWLHNKTVMKKLRRVIENRGLTGLVLVYSPSQTHKSVTRTDEDWMHSPEPLNVRFEPIELIESDDRVLDLSGIAPADAERHLLPSLFRSLYGNRVFLIQAASLATMFLWVRDRWTCLIFTIALLGQFPQIAFSLIRKDRWFLVPGGVVVRRVWPYGAPRLLRFSPADSILVVRPTPPGGTADLYSGQSSVTRNCSQAECAALLRVWSSGLEMPEKLDDLQ